MTNPFFSKKSSAASPEQHETPSTQRFTEHTPEHFKVLAEQLLQDLRTQQQNSRTLQSSLPLLLKHYAFDQSYLDQAAHWYTKTAWWYEKVGVFLLFTCIPPIIPPFPSIRRDINSLLS